jgi:hypothetical protein
MSRTAAVIVSIATIGPAATRPASVTAAASRSPRGVAIQPGTMQFTRAAPSSAVVKRIGPAFVAAYAGER